MLDLNTIFELIKNRQDTEAKALINQLVSGTDSKINEQHRQLISTFLNEKMLSLSTVEEIDTIDVFAHFADLELLALENDSTVEDFHKEIIDVEDLGSYNGCGRRSVRAVVSQTTISYFNDRKNQRETFELDKTAEALVVK